MSHRLSYRNTSECDFLRQNIRFFCLIGLMNRKRRRKKSKDENLKYIFY